MEAIFLQYIGIKWSVFWKQALQSFRRTPGIWKSSQSSIPLLDRKRRDFYLGTVSYHPSVVSERLAIYRNGYFLSQLLDNESQQVVDEEGEEEAEMEAVQEASFCQAQSASRTMSRKRVKGLALSYNAPRKQLASKAARRHPSPGPIDYEAMEYGSERYKPKNSMEAKQNLLHLCSAEIHMQSWLRGEISCFRTQVDSLYPSLPHTTVEVLMEFLGVSTPWLQFFKRFLQAPLRFKDDGEPRVRKNGTPGSHVLSEVFGEVVSSLSRIPDVSYNHRGSRKSWQLPAQTQQPSLSSRHAFIRTA